MITKDLIMLLWVRDSDWRDAGCHEVMSRGVTSGQCQGQDTGHDDMMTSCLIK